MQWILAFHIIFVICWFAGLFYLPRLFVYHAMSEDNISIERFKVMERKLYYGITWPSAVLASSFGIGLFSLNISYYHHQMWMIIKLILVLLLWYYHLLCGSYYKQFKQDNNCHSHTYYRWFNEIPVLLLAAIVILVVVKP